MSDCENVQKVFVPVKEKEPLKPAASFEITDLAVEKIRHFLEIENRPEGEWGLKIGVRNDGCSGKSYAMDLAPVETSRAAGDKIFEKNGATVIIEKLSYMFLIGSYLDYTETLLMSGFQLKNPNIKSSCSCGSSFSV